MKNRFFQTSRKQMVVILVVMFMSIVIVGGANADRELQDVSGLKQYAERYRVSENEALERLNLQAEFALVGEELYKNEWEHLGGIWFEHEPEFKYIVAITGNEEKIRAYFDNRPLSEHVEIVNVDIALSDLEELLELTNRIAVDFETNHSTSIIQ